METRRGIREVMEAVLGESMLSMASRDVCVKINTGLRRRDQRALPVLE